LIVVAINGQWSVVRKICFTDHRPLTTEMFSPVLSLIIGTREKVKQENLYNETEIRRFLLGELEENERVALEEKFLADENLFVQIRVAEDELIEDYVRGTLAEKEKFEREFLTTEKRRERVEFTRQMIAKLGEKPQASSEKTTFFASLIEFFRQPKFAFGAAFAILALIFGFWFLVIKKSANEGEIVKQITPTPNIQTNVNQTSTANQNITANSISNSSVNANLPEKPQTNKANTNTEIPKKPEEKPKEIAPNPVLALFAGGVRSEGKSNELNLPKTSKGANLVLNLEAQDYQTYRAEIVDQNGNVIYRSGKLRARNSKINAFVPAKNLKRGDYILKLYGFNSQNAEESAADFQFRVNQK